MRVTRGNLRDPQVRTDAEIQKVREDRVGAAERGSIGMEGQNKKEASDAPALLPIHL